MNIHQHHVFALSYLITFELTVVSLYQDSYRIKIKRHGKDKRLLKQIRNIILEVEAAESAHAITNLKKLKAEGSLPHTERQLPNRPDHQEQHRYLCPGITPKKDIPLFSLKESVSRYTGLRQ